MVAARAERDHAALGPLPPAPYLVVERTTRVVARDGLFSFEGRRYAVPDARPGERVELVLGAAELKVYSKIDGRRLARHERGPPRRSSRTHRAVGFVGAGARRVAGTGGPIAGRLSVRTSSSSMAELMPQRIRRNASELRFHAIAEDPDELIERAEAAQLGYREFLDLLLESEVGALQGRRYQARLKMARLPHRKTSMTPTSAFTRIWTPSASPTCAPCASSNAGRAFILGPP